MSLLKPVQAIVIIKSRIDMNLLAIDIGNTNITIALFLDGKSASIEHIAGEDRDLITEVLEAAWERIPLVKSAKDAVKDALIVVGSVKPQWTADVEDIVADSLGQKIRLIGKDIPVPIEIGFKKNVKQIGTDRLLAAAAAYQVVESAVIVADFGTAITIDVVDDDGKFLGGCILPGFELSSDALSDGAAQLPKVTVKKPAKPFGQSTNDAINCGLYYSAVSSLQEIVRRYAEHLGRWPQTVVTGRAAEIIKEDCDFIDSFVPDLVVKGIAIAYNKYLEGMA